MQIILRRFLLGTFLLCVSHVGAKETKKEAVGDLFSVTALPFGKLVKQQQYSVPARIVSLNQPMLSAQLSANAVKINVDIGDNVKKGDVLVELDCRDFQHAEQQARAVYLGRKAQLAFTKKTYQRNKKLIEQSTIPQNSLDQSESDYLSIQADINALKAQLGAAELNVGRCHIVAPFAGQITQRDVQKGQLVSPNTPLMELLQTTNLQISVELSGKEALAAKRADKHFFRVNNKNTEVTLHTIVSLIKNNTGTQAARFYLPKDSQLVVGTAGRIIWKSSQTRLPAGYLSQRKGKFGVFILHPEKNKAKVEFVPIAHAQEGQAINIKLAPDTLIIDKGRLSVQDKQMVRTQ